MKMTNLELLFSLPLSFPCVELKNVEKTISLHHKLLALLAKQSSKPVVGCEKNWSMVLIYIISQRSISCILKLKSFTPSNLNCKLDLNISL